MESIVAQIMANPIASAVVTVLAVVIAFKMAFYTIKKVIANAVMGAAVYLVATQILHIQLDPSLWVWGLTILFGPIPMAILAGWHIL
ncbi:MAG: hypothetical protein HUJ84_02390 [Veillonella sp.]|nr:hypothetical protein [Veillonella sp.]MCF0156195.1 hypothetical protein [Veillonella sp.]